MRCGLIIAICAVGLLCAASVNAGRIYGTANLLYQHMEEEGQRVIFVVPPGEFEPDTAVVSVGTADDLSQESFILNYEDVLFYKNRIRFGANLFRRELAFSDRREFRPIYSFDLRSFGYSFSTSYSPFKQLALLPSGVLSTKVINIYNRDWRTTASINYPKLPTLGFVYNHTKAYDRELVRRYDSYSKTTVIETGYSVGPFTARAFYNRLRQETKVGIPSNNTNQSYTGSAGFGSLLPRVGYLSTNYTYFNTRFERAGSGPASVSKSFNHSMNALFSSERYHNLGVSASYSGRFFENELQLSTIESRSQTMSAQVIYTPLSYLSLEATKSYQLNDQQNAFDITEYVAFSGTVTRALRRGVDTRFTAARTMYQQSTQRLQAGDDGKYNLDSYYGSLGFEPVGYIRTLTDISILHNSEPFVEDQRYQVSYSMNSRFALTRRIEGRFSANGLYQGAKLQLGRTYSQNYNLGVTWTPQSNLTLNLGYVYTALNAVEKVSTGSFTGFASYSFRRAFTLSFNATRQEQETTITGTTGQFEKIELAPYTLNGQMQVFLSRRTTLGVGYLYTKATNRSKLEIVNRSLQAQLNMQL